MKITEVTKSGLTYSMRHNSMAYNPEIRSIVLFGDTGYRQRIDVEFSDGELVMIFNPDFIVESPDSIASGPKKVVVEDNVKIELSTPAKKLPKKARGPR